MLNRGDLVTVQYKDQEKFLISKDILEYLKSVSGLNFKVTDASEDFITDTFIELKVENQACGYTIYSTRRTYEDLIAYQLSGLFHTEAVLWNNGGLTRVNSWVNGKLV